VLRQVPNKPLDVSPIPIGEEKPLDWDVRLGIDMIRSHAKIDDIPSVTDEQLRLYRSAALDSAEHYTGLLLRVQRTVTEPIEGPAPNRLRPYVAYYTHRLQYPVADGYVYLYGGTHIVDNATFQVVPGSRKIKVPIKKDMIDLTNCCDPCAKPWAVNGGMLATYRAGYKSAEDVPTTVVLGMLQFMTWAIEHPGDELLTQRSRIETRAGLAGLQGSNNIAMISGAIETWRILDNEAW
jgi:hypothetical protein